MPIDSNSFFVMLFREEETGWHRERETEERDCSFAQDRVESYCYFGFSCFSLGRTNGWCLEAH